jgi:endonuclease YncB( thermonuclease family)
LQILFSYPYLAQISDLIAGKSVVVDYSKYDRYQRILGKVLLSGEDVNLEQVEAGFAWHYKQYQGEQTPSDRVEYSNAEREARRLKVGLWHDPNPVPPWDYRQAERDRRKNLEPFVGKSTVRGAQ